MKDKWLTVVLVVIGLWLVVTLTGCRTISALSNAGRNISQTISTHVDNVVQSAIVDTQDAVETTKKK